MIKVILVLLATVTFLGSALRLSSHQQTLLGGINPVNVATPSADLLNVDKFVRTTQTEFAKAALTSATHQVVAGYMWVLHYTRPDGSKAAVTVLEQPWLKGTEILCITKE